MKNSSDTMRNRTRNVQLVVRCLNQLGYGFQIRRNKCVLFVGMKLSHGKFTILNLSTQLNDTSDTLRREIAACVFC
jgi:hypothetical protein